MSAAPRRRFRFQRGGPIRFFGIFGLLAEERREELEVRIGHVLDLLRERAHAFELA